MTGAAPRATFTLSRTSEQDEGVHRRGVRKAWPVLENEALVHEAPAIVGCQTPSVLSFPEHLHQ